MTNKGNTQQLPSVFESDVCRRIERLFSDYPWVYAAFVLGSAVRGALRPRSDIDIALLPGPGYKPSPFERVEITGQLEDILGREADVGILGTHNLIYAKEAYFTGRCIYSKDNYYRDLFGATALGLYYRLRQERKEVEDAYRAE